MRLLVIEDDDAIRSVLERGLAAEGFEVVSRADGTDGLWAALDGGFAAIILDLLLPGMNGYQVCERLRAEGVTTPVLVLTAKSGEFDQIDLLDAGADDYLVKPASIALIAARLRVLMRRTTSSGNHLRRGELTYDLSTRVCLVAGVEVALAPREDQLLRQLLLANGACVSRHELVDHLWGPDRAIDGSNLDIQVRRLRAKLAPVAVENVRGLGFRIVA